MSVYPHLPQQPRAPGVGVQLRTANGSAMDTYGSRQIALQFGPRRFDWTFLLADVSMPILGSDFLRHHHLLVDVARARLLDVLVSLGVFECSLYLYLSRVFLWLLLHNNHCTLVV